MPAGPHKRKLPQPPPTARHSDTDDDFNPSSQPPSSPAPATAATKKPRKRKAQPAPADTPTAATSTARRTRSSGQARTERGGGGEAERECCGVSRLRQLQNGAGPVTVTYELDGVEVERRLFPGQWWVESGRPDGGGAAWGRECDEADGDEDEGNVDGDETDADVDAVGSSEKVHSYTYVTANACSRFTFPFPPHLHSSQDEPQSPVCHVTDELEARHVQASTTGKTRSIHQPHTPNPAPKINFQFSSPIFSSSPDPIHNPTTPSHHDTTAAPMSPSPLPRRRSVTTEDRSPLPRRESTAAEDRAVRAPSPRTEALLESEFDEASYPRRSVILDIAIGIAWKVDDVERWFERRRARDG
ncbi:uncharacterized protein EV422DRAFT_546906 [Fimicolochytrium jonesii]|uniref:uncharacterized protein n=1 Tax=Fimicolochytrium jonesii TaxID=1396493 RepID=UPI0022FDB0E0|nr:uncharacterized protein EV422DRAFT_546906 [Fimicolochytrium jonesii]KAI8816135.1 hypothetical protein EV422DRAFT_546906 [Fimicolochytrium jonesii]